MLSLTNYKKQYGKRVILQSDSFIFKGQLTWIGGVNGSGKSTLLKSIAGIIPFEGDMHLNGLSQKKEPVKYRRKVTFSEAEPEYPAYLSGIELLGFIAMVRKLEYSIMEELISYFNMEAYVSQPFGGYSSGMLKKVSLCQAFFGDPDLILLDEPFSFIDQNTETLLASLITKKTGAGTQVIFTSHHGDYQEELPLTDRFDIVDKKIKKVR